MQASPFHLLPLGERDVKVADAVVVDRVVIMAKPRISLHLQLS